MPAAGAPLRCTMPAGRARWACQLAKPQRTPPTCLLPCVLAALLLLSLSGAQALQVDVAATEALVAALPSSPPHHPRLSSPPPFPVLSSPPPERTPPLPPPQPSISPPPLPVLSSPPPQPSISPPPFPVLPSPPPQPSISPPPFPVLSSPPPEPSISPPPFPVLSSPPPEAVSPDLGSINRHHDHAWSRRRRPRPSGFTAAAAVNLAAAVSVDFSSSLPQHVAASSSRVAA